MHSPAGKASREAHAREAYLAIERFLKASHHPVLIEPGEDSLELTVNSFAMSVRGAQVHLDCWDDKRNLSRRVTGVKTERPGRLELAIETFGRKNGTLTLADLARSSNHHLERQGLRLKFRERFRESLHRQFPDWHVAEISTEQDLHHSFSPVYPRALLRKGNVALAAIGAPDEAAAPEAALSFGLIWLDHLRRTHMTRDAALSVGGLVLIVPAGREHALCHRLRFLDPNAAAYFVFVHDSAAFEQQINPQDYTNLETRLDPIPSVRPRFSARKLAALPKAEAVLESRIRADIETIDADLLREPIYSQIPQFAGIDRGLSDLVAVGRDGQLAVLELKVDQDIHLPLQALDYWMRVKWHLDRGDFAARGFFPGIALSPQAPRVLLVAPAMEFHPTNEIILRYLSPDVPVERIGIGMNWRDELKVVYRPPGVRADVRE